MSADFELPTVPIDVLFQRLGIELATASDYGAQDKGRLTTMLKHLGNDVSALGRLAEKNQITLYQLSTNNLLPEDLARHVKSQAPATTEQSAETNSFYHKPIGELSEVDHALFAKQRGVGRVLEGYLRLLVRINRDTCNFRALPWPHNVRLTEPEQKALLARIRIAVRKDPNVQRQLLAMFPGST